MGASLLAQNYNMLASAGNMGLIPDLGRSHMSRSN